MSEYERLMGDVTVSLPVIFSTVEAAVSNSTSDVFDLVLCDIQSTPRLHLPLYDIIEKEYS